MVKKDSYDRIWDMIIRIKDDGGLVKIHPDIVSDYAEQTIYKLVSFSQMISVYCNVMRKSRRDSGWPKKCYFLDLMAGAGCTKVRDRNIHVVGSAILASKISSQNDMIFDKIICIEKEPDRARVLRERLETIYPSNRIEVISGKSEEYIPQIHAQMVAEKAHFLGCVDYQNTEGPGFDDLRPLFEIRGDMMVTLMAHNLYRAIKQSETQGFIGTSADTISHFFGEGSSWQDVGGSADVQNLYCSNIENYNRRVEQVLIRNESTGFWFTTCFSCKMTKSGAPFLDAISELNDFFVSKPDILNEILNRMEGRSTNLDDFV